MTVAPATALRLIEVLAAAGVLIASLEFLARPHALSDSSLASWPILRLRHPHLSGGFAGTVLNGTVAYPRVLGVLAIRAMAATCLVFTQLHGLVHAALLATVVMASAVLTLRGPSGGEGADQVLRIIFWVLLLAALHPTTVTMRLCLWFLALQACLAYFASGIYKITSPMWRDGTGLAGILGTRRYGNHRMSAVLAARPALARWGSRGIGLMETLFPLVLIAPPPWLPVFLGCGFLFHVGCAGLMRINCFVWAFAALYPAVAYVVLSG